MVVFGQSCCIQANLVVFVQKLVVLRQKWLYSVKAVLFRKNGCNLAKWLYSGKAVVLEQVCL